MNVRIFAISVIASLAGASAHAWIASHPATIQLRDPNFIDHVVWASVRIDGIDNRGEFNEEKARSLGMNIDEKSGYPNDLQDIRNGFGTVQCPGTIGKYPDPKRITDPTGKRYNSSSQLGGLIVQSDDLLVTNTHGLIDAYGRVRDPLSKCTFTNHAGKKVNLGLSDGISGLREAVRRGKVKISGIDLDRGEPFSVENSNDRVLIRLPETFPGAAFKLEGNPSLHECWEKKPTLETSRCQRIAVVSAFQDRMPVAVKQNALIAQENFIREIYESEPGRGRFMTTGASTTSGASASVVFAKASDGSYIRDYRGRLRPIGILKGGSEEIGDGRDFGITLENGRVNLTAVLLFDSDFEGDILAMSVNRK